MGTMEAVSQTEGLKKKGTRAIIPCFLATSRSDKIYPRSVWVLQCVDKLGWERYGYLLSLALKQEVVLLLKPVWVDNSMWY